MARIEAGLKRDDPRREAALVLSTAGPTTTTLDAARASLTKAIEVGHQAADREHWQSRNFRNAVIIACVAITFLLVLFAGYVWNNPATVPLCFTPTTTSTATVSPPSSTGSDGDRRDGAVGMPTGEYSWNAATPEIHGPTNKHDVVVVLLLGLLGGALSAAISIRGLSGTSTPYDVPFALAALKLPLGALTALGALIALQGDLVPGAQRADPRDRSWPTPWFRVRAADYFPECSTGRHKRCWNRRPGRKRRLGTPSARSRLFPCRWAPGWRPTPAHEEPL